MRGFFPVSTNLDAKVAEETDFSDHDHKEYKVVFEIYDRRTPPGDSPRRYTVFITRGHLIKTISYGDDYYEDSKKAAIAFAMVVLKQRFNFANPEENAAICQGKICQYTTI
jgi:hypothetical protein